jgi:nitrate reductase NapAB chaperone NapD
VLDIKGSIVSLNQSMGFECMTHSNHKGQHIVIRVQIGKQLVQNMFGNGRITNIHNVLVVNIVYLEQKTKLAFWLCGIQLGKVKSDKGTES